MSLLESAPGGACRLDMSVEEVDPGALLTPTLAEFSPYLLRLAGARTRQVMSAAMPAGSHPRFFAVLDLLAHSDALSQQDVADRLGINPTVMVKLIDRLEEIDYVTRTRNPADRRSYVLTLTATGRRTHKVMVPAVARGEEALAAPLRPAERDRLRDLLVRLLPDPGTAAAQPSNRRIGYLLVHVDMLLNRRADAVLGALGLGMRQFGALATTAEIGPCTQQELGLRLGIAEAAMTQLVDDLQGRGLVRRGRDRKDRRRYALLLSADGRGTLGRAVGLMRGLEQELAAEIGGHGDKELRDLLAKLT